MEQIKGETDFLVVISISIPRKPWGQYAQYHARSLEASLRRAQSGTESHGNLSNYATDSLVTASCRIAFLLEPSKDKGREIAEKIALASQFYRLILTERLLTIKDFNGIDAILIATGNDGVPSKLVPMPLLVEMDAIKV